MTDFRIGHGYDVHALADGLRLVLGGIEIPHTKGCVAHSDGDVAIHAVCDALLGAAALGDIGLHFPDTSDDFAGIDSKILLRRVAALLRERGYEIGNVDCTIRMQRPKLRPHIDAMRAAMAGAMGVGDDRVSVKATTTEHLGFEGREEGVSVSAVALIYKSCQNGLANKKTERLFGAAPPVPGFSAGVSLSAGTSDRPSACSTASRRNAS